MMFVVLLSKTISLEMQWSTSWAVTGLIFLIFSINVAILIYDNILKIKLYFKKRKFLKRQKRRRNKVSPNDS